MVDNSRVISSMLPIPIAEALDRKIPICHFIIKAPKKNPIKKRATLKGKYFVTILNSFLLRAGFKNDNIWISRTGKTAIKPVAMPTLIARLINWKGEVKTIFIPSRERAFTIKEIMLS